MRELDQQAAQFGVTMSQREREFVAGLGVQQFNQYQAGLNAGLLNEMEPADKQNWLHNYNSVWVASGTLPFDINMDNFPPSTPPAP